MNPCPTTHRSPAWGATLCTEQDRAGVRFAVWAPHATALQVALFDSDGHTEEKSVALQPQGQGAWAAFVPGLQAGQLYGLRAHGPWQPQAGHRFNPAKLLLDPWAKALAHPSLPHFDHLALQTGHHCPDPFHPERSWHHHQPDPHDNAHALPRCVVVDTDAEHAAGQALCRAPRVPADRVLVYEAHVKALTQRHPDVPPALRGTYAGLAHPAVVQHLQALGITTVCLLPVHTHITERHLLQRQLVNHWGYNTLNAFAPEHSYAASTQGQPPRHGAQAAAVATEFRHMVDTLHRAGMEVVLDVVFNHTCESDPDGPTLSWRGLGQADWYAMSHDGIPHNFTGCGNSLNTSEPRVLQWVMDSLRWWVQVHGIDGFRFDLGVSLGRDAALGHRFNPHHALLSAMAQDPVLAGVRLIAEPWDVGPDGHHTGGFGPGWCEWNDRFRDTVRAFWLGHPATRGELAQRVCGSSDLFGQGPEAGRRRPTASINLLTAHDGFTLHDLTAYTQKHNQANGEDNRDGHGHNLSANAGAEGPSTDPAVLHRRALWRRALLATLFCAQGTPQLLAGDELGHTQQGNNNAYCQDNPLTWLDWAQADGGLLRYVAQLAALRRRHPALRHPQWFTGQATDTGPDVRWHNAQGHALEPTDWQNPAQRTLCATYAVGDGGRPPSERLCVVWHAPTAMVTVALPPGPWQLALDSAHAWVAGPDSPPPPITTPVHGQLVLTEPGVLVLVQALPGLPPPGSSTP